MHRFAIALGIMIGSAAGVRAESGSLAEILFPSAQRANPQPRPESAPLVRDAAPGVGDQHLAERGAARERPLFSPSRRPPPPPQPALVAAVLPPTPQPVVSAAPDLRLVGIVAGTDAAMAMVRRTGEGRSRTLRVGDIVDGWRVSEIGPARLLLRVGEEAKAYALFASKLPQDRVAVQNVSEADQ